MLIDLGFAVESPCMKLSTQSFVKSMQFVFCWLYFNLKLKWDRKRPLAVYKVRPNYMHVSLRMLLWFIRQRRSGFFFKSLDISCLHHLHVLLVSKRNLANERIKNDVPKILKNKRFSNGKLKEYDALVVTYIHKTLFHLKIWVAKDRSISPRKLKSKGTLCILNKIWT